METEKILNILKNTGKILLDISTFIYQCLIYIIVSKILIFLDIIKPDSVLAAIILFVLLILLSNKFLIFTGLKW